MNMMKMKLLYSLFFCAMSIPCAVAPMPAPSDIPSSDINHIPTTAPTRWWCRDIKTFDATQNDIRWTCEILRNYPSSEIIKMCEVVVTFDQKTLPIKFWCTETCQFYC
mmetsp:Transcript_24787/g.49317  ORF Transcript_24787/g.49317 Transcript_24787/m.49317 type:complete len:108 (+) Transcript_24787:88-411(+)